MITPSPARRDLAVALVALALLLAWDASGLDLALIRPWGDASGFAWQEHWLTWRVAHDGGRALAWAVLIALVVNVWRPLTPLLPHLPRGDRVRWVATTLAALIAVPAIKQLSPTSCPWDLAEFGGRAVHLSHWLVGTSDGGPGRCFPSGHAAAAFAFLSSYFVLRGAHPRAARAWLMAVLAIGATFGFAQMIRGAHFASHTMWSAWLCWTLNATVAYAAARRRAGVAEASPA